MENAPESRMPPKSPISKKKIALLSLGTCMLLGIVGVEVFLENKEKNTPLHTQNFSLSPTISQSEQLQVELNQANQNVNQLKRQLFVRNSAPISAYNRKLQDDFAQKEKVIQELAEAIKNHEVQLSNERAKVATLESSLAALADLIEIQKNSKERFHDTLRLTVESKADESEKHNETLALANEEIDNLKARIANELAEKQALVKALETHEALHHETTKHLATLNDEIAIERTVQTIASQNSNDEHQESISSLRLELHKLQSLLESTQVKLENESAQKENTNQTVIALINKSCLLEAELSSLNEKKDELENARDQDLKELGEKGAALEDELIFTRTAKAIETSRLADNYSGEIESLKKNYEEICATCKDLENGYTDLQRQAEEIKRNNVLQLNDTLSDKSDVEQILMFAKLESKLAQERMTIELEDISYALIAAEHQRDLMKRNLEDHLVVYEEERQENLLKLSQLDAEIHAERIEKQQLLSQLAETHLVKEAEAGYTAEVAQELERAYAYQDSLKDQIKTHQALVLEKQEAWETAINQHQLELAALEEKHSEVQSNLENERNRALEHKETSDNLTRAIAETEEALKAANIAFQILEQESAEKIAALQENLNNKESVSTESLQIISNHKEQIEKQNSYIAELEIALKNAESGLHQAASALELFDDEISTKTASLNEHIERKEALESELNQHKDALVRSAEVEQNLKLELERVLTEANALSMVLQQKERAIAESQDLDSQTKEEQEARIARLENALDEAKLALENEVRQLKEQHIQEISLADDMHLQSKMNAESLSQKITLLEDELKQKEGSEERIAHLQQTLKETEDALTSNIRTLENEHQDVKSSLKQELEKALAEAEALSLELKHKEGSAEEQIIHLQKTLEETKESLSNSVHELGEKHERKVSELTAMTDTLSHELKQKEIQESALKGELEQSRIQTETLNRDLQQKENDKNAIHETMEQHKARIAQLEEEHDRIVAELTDKHQEILSHELKQKEVQESALKGELEQSRIQTETLNRDLQQKENDMNAIQQTIELHEARIAQLQEEYQQRISNLHLEKEDTESSLKQELDKALAKTESLQSELKEKEEAHQSAAQAVNLYQTHFTELQQALEEVRVSLITTVQQLKENHSREVALIENTVESEKQQKEQIENELRNLASSKEQLAERYNEAIQSIEQLQHEVNAKEGTLQVNTAQVNHLKSEIEHVQNALISEKKQSEDLLLQLETIRNQYENAQSSLEEKTVLEAKLHNLSDALEDQADELNQLKAVKDALENEVKEANVKKEEVSEII